MHAPLAEMAQDREMWEGEVGKMYILIDTGQLSGRPDGRECPCVPVLSLVLFIIVAEDSTRAPQALLLTVEISFIADT